MEKETMVYVIELEQPFINWVGLLKSYDFDKNICIVENDNGDDIPIRFSEAFEHESMISLDEFIKLYHV